MLTLVKPAFDDLWFRKNLMADEETMSYNARWGGTIPFPEEEWESWYESWVRNPGASRYYRYLMNSENEYVGEIAYHYDEFRDIYICDVIVLAQYRNGVDFPASSWNGVRSFRPSPTIFPMLLRQKCQS